MNQAEEIKDFLLQPTRRKIVSVKAIEQQAGIPAGALAGYLNGKVKTLADRHVPAIFDVLKNIGFIPAYLISK